MRGVITRVLLAFVLLVLILSGTGPPIYRERIANAAPALERLPDFSTWRTCGETEQPRFYHRRFANQVSNVFWLASAFYEDKAARQPMFAVVIRAEIRIGRPSDLAGEIYSFVRTGADSVLVASAPLRTTEGASAPIWPPDSELGRRFVAWLTERGELESLARMDIPTYHLRREVSGNRATIRFGFARAALHVSDGEEVTRIGFVCI
jgi:hypothetical protein